MRDIEHFLDRVVDCEGADSSAAEIATIRGVEGPGQAAMAFNTEPSESQEVGTNPLRGILRRWYLVLLVFVFVAGIGVTGIWMVMEPGYLVRGYLQVLSMQEDPLTGSMNRVNYGSLQTEAISVLTPQMIDRVADDLGDGNLEFFAKNYDLGSRLLAKVGLERYISVREPARVLHEAKQVGVIKSGAIRDTELVAVTMKSMEPEEAKLIVNSFLVNYSNYFNHDDTSQSNEALRHLRDEKTQLRENMDNALKRIKKAAAQYGSTELTVEQEMAARRYSAIYERLSSLEARRVNIEIRLEILESQEDSNRPVSQDTAGLNQYINQDPTVQELTQDLVSLKRELIIIKQTLNEKNPLVTEKRNLVNDFERQLSEKRSDLKVQYYDLMKEQQSSLRQSELVATELELKRLKAEEERLSEMLNKEDIEKRQVGQASMEIQDSQFQFNLDKDLFNQVSRRIRQIEMESNMDPTIKVHSGAAVESFEDKRTKMSAAAIVGGLGLGCLVAFLFDKGDKRLHFPEEIQKHIAKPLLGTICKADLHKELRTEDRFIADYQAVRTNLALLNRAGIPNKFVVVSPGSKDGKTTFCINLATSLAGAGKHVLLIDGDLRRPNVMQVLGVESNTNGSQETVADADLNYTIYSVASSGFTVLAPEVHCMADPFELVSSPTLNDRILQLGTQYDHIIIDTPPILAFPDAIYLAHVAGSALVVTFCGRTKGPDLSESVSRLERAGVDVLGTVMNNVPADHSFYRYGYGYDHGYSQYHHNDQKRVLSTTPNEGS